jgi:predicted transcriptional regulator
MEEFMLKSKRLKLVDTPITFRPPQELADKIDMLAEKENRSRSNMMIELLREALRNHLKLIACAFLLIATTARGQSLPDAPSATVDKPFLTLVSVNALFTGLDAFTTLTRIGPHQFCTYEANNPELYGRHPYVARVTLVMGGMTAAGILASYELKRHRVRIWRIPLWELPAGYDAYGHALGATHNFTYCR